MPFQLTTHYRIPEYAQDMLYIGVQNIEHVEPTRGELGEFALPYVVRDPHPAIYLMWGSVNGPLLGYWRSPKITNMGLSEQAYVPHLNLKWDGRIHVGGNVERIHAFQVEDTELIVAEIVGGVFADDYIGLPTLEDMRTGKNTRPVEQEPLRGDQVYTFLVEAESNFAALLQDALVSRITVDASGILAEDEEGWHQLLGLPLLLDTLTLIAP
jgi:hypothetical protein